MLKATSDLKGISKLYAAFGPYPGVTVLGIISSQVGNNKE